MAVCAILYTYVYIRLCILSIRLILFNLIYYTSVLIYVLGEGCTLMDYLVSLAEMRLRFHTSMGDVMFHAQVSTSTSSLHVV